jgi:hypothetical protein
MDAGSCRALNTGASNFRVAVHVLSSINLTINRIVIKLLADLAGIPALAAEKRRHTHGQRVQSLFHESFSRSTPATPPNSESTINASASER